MCGCLASLKLGYELIDRRRILISGDDYRVDLEIIAAELIDQPHDLQVICDAEVLTGLALDDISGINADDDLCFVAHLLQELDLGILVKARKYSHSVLVLYELAAELKIEPAFAALYPLEDVLGLLFDILLCAESLFLHITLLSLLQRFISIPM